MARTTISMQKSILRQVQSIATREHTTLGKIVSELLSLGIKQKEKQHVRGKKAFALHTFSMGTPRISLEDKQTIQALIEKRVV